MIYHLPSTQNYNYLSKKVHVKDFLKSFLERVLKCKPQVESCHFHSFELIKSTSASSLCKLTISKA